MTTGRINRGQEVSGLNYCLLLSTLPLGSSNDLLRAVLLLFLTVELPAQNNELSNNTTLPSFSDSVLAVDIPAMSSNHTPEVSLAESVHIGTRFATSAVRFSFSHRRVQLTFIAFKTSRTRRVTLHFCSEGRPVGANLNHQSVATDKVRGHLVKPFACRIQLCKHLRFDRIRHFTHLVHSCTTVGRPYISRGKLPWSPTQRQSFSSE